MKERADMRLPREEIGIKDHREMDVGMAECCDCRYLEGEDPAEYSMKQENELAQNVRKHRAP